MSDLHEILALTADVRAALDHAAVRGWREDPREMQAVAAPVVAAPVALPLPPPPRGDPWAKLAAEARSARDPAAGLAAVRADLGDCRRCPLHKDRAKIVFGVGDPAAHLVIVGEAPGYHEDQQGEPFIGPAGQMLDKMLENVLGLPRSWVYILNVVKCKPPKNRSPLAEEIAACRPFLEGQIEAIAPKAILVLGGVAFQALFGVPGTAQGRGTWHEYQGIPTLPTFHPEHLLRTPDAKRLTFADLKLLRGRYDELGGKRPAFQLGS